MIGLDSSPDMVFRAREAYDDVQLARIEDPLPDGPWDLVIGVLSIHHLTAEQKKNLFRQVREQARSLRDRRRRQSRRRRSPRSTRTTTSRRRADDLAEWSGGEITWARTTWPWSEPSIELGCL